jgi:sugar lactone lactonase YvrE
MAERKSARLIWVVLVILIAAILSVAPGKNNSTDAPYVRLVRVIETASFIVPHPAGLTYLPQSGLFSYLSVPDPPVDGGQRNLLMLVSFADEPQGTVALADDLANTLNISFSPLSRRLFIFNDVSQELVEYSLDAEGRPDPTTRLQFAVGHFGVTEANGMTIDPESGDLFMLDGNGGQILRVSPALGDPSGGAAYQAGELSRISVKSLPRGSLRGLAFNPANGYLYLLHVSSRKLFGVSTSGQVMSERDLKAVSFQDPCGMVFAPSGDRTDHPENLSLYLSDCGLPDTRRTGQILEFSLTEPFPSASATLEPLVLDPFQSSLVRTIQTSQLFPPSPDTAGLAFHSSNGTIFYSDSEVNEVDIFEGYNYFEMTIGGTLVGSMSTLGFGSKEPTGMAYNAINRHMFISDDDRRRVYEVNPGGDGLFDTSDDQITSIDTTLFDSFDPEGVAFDSANQILYIADGVNNEVYIVRPGNNGVFDGISPDGDDQLSQFDTAGFGMVDPEGIEFDDANGHLYMVGHGDDDLLTEISTDGTLLREIDVSAANALALSGLARAPSSYNSQVFSIYICDRGVDNGADPDENDGRIYEMTLPESDSADGEAPTVTAFDLPDTSDSLTVPILSFTATDNVGVTGYLATESSSTPSAGDSGWQSTAPTEHTFGSDGSQTLYGWARDAAGNVSASLSDTVLISTGSGDQVVVDNRISADNDDAEESGSGSMDLTSSDLELGTEGGSPQTVGMRFNNLNIPQGATIVEAYIQFTVDETDSGETSVVIRGEAADNAAEFSSTSNNITSRPQTAASVSWEPPAWTTVGAAGEDQRTPDIAPIIQEIVNRSAWAQGNALVILVAGTGERTAESYNGSSPDAPLLHVVYDSGGSSGDTTPPTVTDFDLPDTSDTLTVPILTFTATDDVGVTGYLATESSSTPSAGDSGWQSTAPTEHTFGSAGSQTLYGWARDAAGNVSSSLSDTVDITLADTTPPTVTAFDLPDSSDSLTVPILTFTATDDVGVTGYLATESSSTPSASDSGWQSTAPTEHTFGSAGSQTLYGWAKDSAGNVSVSLSDIVVITLGTLHVGDLDGSVNVKGRSANWEAFVTITVHDQNHNPVAGAVVSGAWSGDGSGTVSGTTGTSGTVTLGSGNIQGGSTVTFSVTGVSHVDFSYDAGSNHDPDGDSDGNSIVVNRP